MCTFTFLLLKKPHKNAVIRFSLSLFFYYCRTQEIACRNCQTAMNMNKVRLVVLNHFDMTLIANKIAGNINENKMF